MERRFLSFDIRNLFQHCFELVVSAICPPCFIYRFNVMLVSMVIECHQERLGLRGRKRPASSGEVRKMKSDKTLN